MCLLVPLLIASASPFVLAPVGELQAEFAPTASLLAPVLTPRSGWRLVDINYTTPSSTFSKTAEPCIKKELELQVLLDAAEKEAEEGSEPAGEQKDVKTGKKD